MIDKIEQLLVELEHKYNGYIQEYFFIKKIIKNYIQMKFNNNIGWLS